MTESLYALRELPEITGGEIYRAPGFSDGDIFSVVCDSRGALPGCLFVPLKGNRTDGHFYIEEVFSRGGRVSFVDKSFWNIHADALRASAAKFRGAYIIVEKPLAALQTLAANYMAGRKVFRIGISGSSGKTTTKEITGAILSQEAPSFMNRGNLNSEIGLPLSVFEMKKNSRFAVMEMGVDHEGEMDILTTIVKPEAALITNIGYAHAAGFGSREKIAAEKKKLFLALEKGRRAYACEADPYFEFLRRDAAADVLPFGETTTPGFEGAEDLGLEGYNLFLDGKTLRFALPGAFNLRNALGAVSLCKGLGIPEKAIRGGLETVKPLAGRGQVFRGDITIFEDYYNANPDSMAKAIGFIDSLAWGGRKIAVLGSMKDLGEVCGEAHRDIGARIGNSGFAGVFLFGDEMEAAYDCLQKNHFSGVARFFKDFDKLKAEVESFTAPGDIVLIKGSRSMAMERIARGLRKDGGAGNV
jgi:UDP-N-acetylmuramoyl-tripeptide--D-alanyl-D-alanine ligase